jgi:hypothetical protein
MKDFSVSTQVILSVSESDQAKNVGHLKLNLLSMHVLVISIHVTIMQNKSNTPCNIVIFFFSCDIESTHTLYAYDIDASIMQDLREAF